MLGAHNVPVALDAAKLGGLTVAADGSVSGDYGYTPPVPQAPAAPAPTPAASPPAGLTREMLKDMPHDEINRRWDEVKKVLAQPA